MTNLSFIFAVRFVLALVFASVIIFTPIAEARHTNDAPVISCEMEDHDAAEVSAPASDHEHDHDHHRHNCGSCHVHILGRDTPQTLAGPDNPSTSYRLTATQLVNGARPSLFRPPRA